MTFTNDDLSDEFKRIKAAAKTGVINVDDITKATESSLFTDAALGFCISCGHAADGVEPDACNYECESCGAKAVFGAQELFISLVA